MNSTLNIDIDNTIRLMENQIKLLKSRLEEERTEHREIYLKIKKENDLLKDENSFLKNVYEANQLFLNNDNNV